MSATKPQFDNRLIEEAENISRLYYGKPYAELDERQQELMRRSARVNLRKNALMCNPVFAMAAVNLCCLTRPNAEPVTIRLIALVVITSTAGWN